MVRLGENNKVGNCDCNMRIICGRFVYQTAGVVGT